MCALTTIAVGYRSLGAGRTSGARPSSRNIIEREDLELLQNTNFVAHAAATFNNFDTSVFNNEDLEIEEQNATDDDANVTAASVGATRDEAVEFQLTIPYLPCIPDEGVMLDAWEDILPWVSRSEHQPRRKSTSSQRRAVRFALACCTLARSACAITNSKQCCLL